MKYYVSRPNVASPFYRLNKPVVVKSDVEDETFELDGKRVTHQESPYWAHYGETAVELTEEEAEVFVKNTVDFLETQAQLAFMFHGKNVEYKFMEKYND